MYVDVWAVPNLSWESAKLSKNKLDKIMRWNDTCKINEWLKYFLEMLFNWCKEMEYLSKLTRIGNKNSSMHPFLGNSL